jgi:hypothetical protein
VSVKKGVVTLTGTVDGYAKKLAAQKATHSVPGVLDVASDGSIFFHCFSLLWAARRIDLIAQKPPPSPYQMPREGLIFRLPSIRSNVQM